MTPLDDSDIEPRAAARALAHITARAASARGDARTRLVRLLGDHGHPAERVEELTAALRADARVTVSFHPDRSGKDGRTVVDALLADGEYRSQFVTGVTNGSPTAFAGGARDAWEKKLFGGAYHHPDVAPEDRPTYGALNVFHYADGASPRFGSCYLELHSHVTPRCSLTWGDSHFDPDHVGTIAILEPLIACMMHEVQTEGTTLGLADANVDAIVAHVLASATRGRSPRASRHVGRALDAYIEAQIHGALRLADNVAAVVIDPSFDGTPTGDKLAALAARYRFELHRHPGFVLLPREVPPDFRGPEMVPLAARVATFSPSRDRIDAAAIGDAAALLAREPDAWADWAPPDATWQHLKQLWHVLVRYGHPQLTAREPDR